MNITELAIYKKMFGGGGTASGGILEVNELPTENIDTNAFYLCKGEYYRYVEGGNTWVFNDELTKDTTLNCSFAFEFEGYENTKNGTNISYTSFGSACPHIKYKTDYYPTGQTGNYQSVTAYCYDTSYTGVQGWQKEEYKTITITEMPTDENFLAWLKENAKPKSGFAKFTVAPSGTMSITENGTFDVAEFEKAVVYMTPVLTVDNLPTEDINREAFYLLGEDLYRYSDEGWMQYPIAGETVRGTWEFNDTLDFSNAVYGDYRITFTDNGNSPRTCISLVNNMGDDASASGLKYYNPYNYSDIAYIEGEGWQQESRFKTITITHGHDVANKDFINWLKANATKVS